MVGINKSIALKTFGNVIKADYEPGQKIDNMGDFNLLALDLKLKPLHLCSKITIAYRFSSKSY